jgi:hypothetical protein
VCHSQFQVFGNVNNRSNEQQSPAAGYGHKVLQQLSIPGDELTVGGEEGQPIQKKGNKLENLKKPKKQWLLQLKK